MGREMGGRFTREGIYLYLWPIHVEVWQKTTKFYKAIILQQKNYNKKKNRTTNSTSGYIFKENKITILKTYLYSQVHCSTIHDNQDVKVLITQSCPTLCNPVDSSPPGSSVHEFPQARILEWVAISFSRGSSQLRDLTQVFCVAGKFFTIWAAREAPFPV